MVFVALYKDKGIFDIEFWLREYDSDRTKWWSEIRVRMLHKGIIQFAVDHANEPELLEEFSKDLEELQNLRFYLYEKWGNRPQEFDDARKAHNEYYKKVVSSLETFCTKYNFYLDED